MKDIDAIANVTNNELLSFTSETATKTRSPGTFRFFMQKQEAQDITNNEQPQGEDAMKMLNSLGRIINIETQIDGISSEKDTEDSRCDNSNLEELLDGIVGILEGFGLLDYNTDESVLDEISTQIASMVSSEVQNNDMSLKENIKMLSDVIARMPNANEFKSLIKEAGFLKQEGATAQLNAETTQQEVIQMIEKLVSEYQCSFDNTNNTGVKDTDLTQKMDSDQKPETDTIKQMIKTALLKVEGPKTKQVSFVKQKTSNNEKGAEDLEKNNGTVMLNKNMSETLKTTETTKDQAVVAPTQEESAENIAKIAEKITASRIDGKQEFDVTLKPSSLGKLSIKLIMDGDSIKAQIKASDLFVRGIISEQLPELSQTLRDKGINMANIEVVYDNPMFSSTDQQFQGQNQFTGHKGQNMRLFMTNDVMPEESAYSAIMDNTDLSMKNGSVEFIA